MVPVVVVVLGLVSRHFQQVENGGMGGKWGGDGGRWAEREGEGGQ